MAPLVVIEHGPQQNVYFAPLDRAITISSQILSNGKEPFNMVNIQINAQCLSLQNVPLMQKSIDDRLSSSSVTRVTLAAAHLVCSENKQLRQMLGALGHAIYH